MQKLKWMKTYDGKWVNLEQLDLRHVNMQGVYMIWHGGENPRIVRIGQGNIAERLRSHLTNLQIMRFKDYGPLMVTWAQVDNPQICEGIQRYLAEQFKPAIKERMPELPAIAAASPFS